MKNLQILLYFYENGSYLSAFTRDYNTRDICFLSIICYTSILARAVDYSKSTKLNYHKLIRVNI